MTCSLHVDRGAAGRCEHCGRLGCAECMLQVVDAHFCVTCVAERMREIDPLHINRHLLFVLSFIPGLGHLYLGLRVRGLQMAVLWLGSGWLISLLFWPDAFGLVTALAILFSLFDAQERFRSLQRGRSVHDQPLVEMKRLWNLARSNPRVVAPVLIGFGSLLLVRIVAGETLGLLGLSPPLLDRLRIALGQSALAVVLVALGIWIMKSSPE